MDIVERLTAVLKDYNSEKIEVGMETTFEDLGLDSLARVDLLMKIEKEFKIMFDEDLQIETVGQLVEKIRKLMK